MNRQTLVLIVLLAGSLAWAYGAGRPSTSHAPEAAETVWTVPPDQLARVAYKSGETTVTITASPREGRPGRYLWVEAEGLRERRPRPAAKKRGPPPAAEAQDNQPVNDAFQGNVQTQRFLDEAANLQALRDLGPAKALTLSDFGLPGDPPAYLQVEQQGSKTPLRLELGAVSAAGAARYALSSGNQHVYLVRNSVFRMMTNARRLMERDLFPFQLGEADKIEVQAGDRKAAIYRVDAPPNEPNRWAWAAGGKKGDPAAQEVANGLLRLRALRYLPGPFDAAKQPVTLRATVTKGSEPPATLTLYREGKDDVPAVSSHTVRAVGLNIGLVNSLLKAARAAPAKP